MSTSSVGSFSSAGVSSMHRDINRKVVDAKSVDKLVDIVEHLSNDFNAVNISTAFHRLAKLWTGLPGTPNGSPSPPGPPTEATSPSVIVGATPDGSNGATLPRFEAAVDRLTELALDHVSDFQGQGLGIVLWAYAKLGYEPPRMKEVLEVFASEATYRLQKPDEADEASKALGSQALSNLVYAYAVMGHSPGPELLTAVARGVQCQLRDFSPQGLSNIVWAYAKMGAQLTPEVRLLLESLAVEAVSQLVDARSRAAFIPQNLSNMVYGYAVLGYSPGPLLLVAAAKEAHRQLADFGPQELTNMVWALAKVGGPLAPEVAGLLDAVPAEFVAQLQDPERHAKVKPQTIANLLWAYASFARSPGKRLLSLLCTEAGRQLPQFRPQELANLLWALGALDYYPGPVQASELCAAAAAQLRHFKPHELANLLWALGALQHHPGSAMLDQLLNELDPQVTDLKPAELAAAAWGLAKLGAAACAPQARRLLAASGQLACSWPGGSIYKPQDVASLAVALATLGALGEAELSGLGAYASALFAQQPADFGQRPLECLFLAQMVAATRLRDAGSAFSPALLHAAEDAWRKVASEGRLSKVHREVSLVLLGLNLSHRLEQPIAGGLLSVDIALQQHKVALDVNPPSALTVNEPHRPLGKTLLRWRLLEAAGWTVVPISCAAWATLAANERATYLQQLLGSSGNALAAAMAGRAALPGVSGTAGGGGGSGVGGGAFPLLRDEVEPSPNSAAGGHGDGIGGGMGGVGGGPGAVMGSSSVADTLSGGSTGSATDGRPGSRDSAALGGDAGDPWASLYERYSPSMGGGSGSDTASRPKQQQQQPALSSGPCLMPLMPGGPAASLGPSGRPFAAPIKLAAGLKRVQSPSKGGPLSSATPRGMPPAQPSATAAAAAAAGLAVAGAGGRAPEGGSMAPSKEAKGDLRQLWAQVMQVGPGQALGPCDASPGEPQVSVAELKRLIAGLPLEKSAVTTVAPHLGHLSPADFALLLQELAKDSHAFRAWQLFDWVRNLPPDNPLRELCDCHTYSTMISLCGPWQQLRRALQLVADMRASGMECGADAYAALLHATIKCNEPDLAVDVYRQMLREGTRLGEAHRSVFHLMIDVFLRLERWTDALQILSDIRAAGLQPEVQTYNLLVVSSTKLGLPHNAMQVYEQMRSDGVPPNVKTFTALISAFSKMGPLDRIFSLVDDIVHSTATPDQSAAVYGAMMSACEKAGEWDLAVSLFDKMCSQGVQPDTQIFNALIAACAHGGEFKQAQAMFDRMANHGVKPDAVSFANLIRAYKKGGQWASALATFERMQMAGQTPHAAVYSSVIDVLWQTGNPWGQAKAAQLFGAAVRSGTVPHAARSVKKGTLKVDLQALTVGAAVLSMHNWLAGLREQFSQEGMMLLLDSNRKLAVVNGMGDHTRSQGNSSAVKEAVGASLVGCGAPFRLVQEHSRSGRLEAPTAGLKKWLFSSAFERYRALFGAVLGGGGWGPTQGLLPTGEYMVREVGLAAQCKERFALLAKCEALQASPQQMQAAAAGGYVHKRKQLVMMLMRFASVLGLTDQVAYAAVTLMDHTMLRGAAVSENLETLFICTCLRIAALHENGYAPSPPTVGQLVNYTAGAVEQMEGEVRAFLQEDMLLISPYHVLKVFEERLDVSPGSEQQHGAPSAAHVLGHAHEYLADLVPSPVSLQYAPSVLAAAVLHVGRKNRGCVPFWPSVLATLTGYSEHGTPPLAAAIGLVERMCSTKAAAAYRAPDLSQLDLGNGGGGAGPGPVGGGAGGVPHHHHIY